MLDSVINTENNKNFEKIFRDYIPMEEDTTPLMEQYHRIKDECKDAILLFRMGDFYETFEDDAVVASKELDIVLTSRQKDKKGNKIPMAGIPHKSLEPYLFKLVKKGYKVAVCDQVEDSAQSNGLVKREITRIVTPGTILESSMLDEKTNNFLSALFEDDKAVGMAFVDVSTGDFYVTDLNSSDIRDIDKKILSEFVKFSPVECIVPSTMTPFLADMVKDISNTLDVIFQKQDMSFFDIDKGRELLLNHFKEDELDSFGIMDKPLIVQVSGAILSYLKSTHIDILDHLVQIKYYTSSDFMVLDDTTIRNLEVFKNIRDTSKKGSLIDYLDDAKTPMGSRVIHKWLQMPSVIPEEIENRLCAVEELYNDHIMLSDVRSLLDGFIDLERISARLSCKIATPKDLINLKQSLKKIPLILTSLDNVRSKKLIDIKERLDLGELNDIISLIEESIVEEPPLTVKDGGIIKDGYNKDLDELRKLFRRGKDWLTDLEQKERERTGIKSLKVGYNTVFGYYIEVSKSNISLVPKDYIRKQTLVNSERYITPQLKEIEEKVLTAEEKSFSLEYELFVDVRDKVSRYVRELKEKAICIGIIDAISSFATVAIDNDLVKPEINNGGTIVIRDSRHPILDKYMKGRFVPNDVYLDEKDNRFIILTGPNMAGKSTYMRQIALIVLLAHIGSFVPARYASIPITDRIFTRVGAYDDLTAGQSTFMVEMSEVANILSNATSHSLIILDEIGKGTSTFDGLSIAWAVSEYIHNKIRAKTLFATHYHQLTQLEDLFSGIKNYNVAVKEDNGSVIFLRKIVPGATDKSYGIYVAKLAGVKKEVVDRAEEILKIIEEETDINPVKKNRRVNKKKRYTQLIFFDESAVPDLGKRGNECTDDVISSNIAKSIIKEIKDIDINNITPLNAFEILLNYKKKLTDS